MINNIQNREASTAPQRTGSSGVFNLIGNTISSGGRQIMAFAKDESGSIEDHNLAIIGTICGLGGALIVANSYRSPQEFWAGLGMTDPWAPIKEIVSMLGL